MLYRRASAWYRCADHSIGTISNANSKLGCSMHSYCVKDNECIRCTCTSEPQFWLQSFFKRIMNETMLDAQKSHKFPAHHITLVYKLETISHEHTIQLHLVVSFNEKSNGCKLHLRVCVSVWECGCLCRIATLNAKHVFKPIGLSRWKLSITDNALFGRTFCN